MAGINSGKEIKVPTEVQNILGIDEKVLLAVQQAGIGGKVTGLESIFITNRRVIKMKPKTFGLRTDVEDCLYKDIANVKLDKGMLRSSISISMRFMSEPVSIESISKGDGDSVLKLIQAGIAGRLEEGKPAHLPDAEVSSSQTDITEQIRKLGELRDSGILTEEEFQAKKKELLSKM